MYKKYFPIFEKNIDNKKLIYFDSACSYLKNKETIKGINDYYVNYSCCSGDRETSFLGTKLLFEISKSRDNIKKFLGAGKNDYIIYTSGATDSINRLIFSLDENKIKTIITSDLEHNSNFLPQFDYSKQKNIDFKIFSYKDILNEIILEEKLKTISGNFLFCFTHSSNIIGGNFNIKNISKLVHKYGGHILVDDAQFISYNKENVVENSIDFLVFSGHKIGGPTGIGVLYIKNGFENIIKFSNKVGGGTIKDILNYEPNYKKIPDFLEGGVQNFSGILGLNSCVKFINNFGINNINEYILDLNKYFLEEFNKNNLFKDIEILSIPNSSIITLNPKNFNVIDFHNYCNYFLNKYIISFRTGNCCADNYINNYLKNNNIFRLSFGIYNNKNDIDIFIGVLKNYIINL